MKALSIRQPWVWLILHGGKRVENRTWKTTYRGRILLHASSRAEPSDAVTAWCAEQGLQVTIPPNLPLGAIVGAVDIVDVVEENSSPWFCGPVGFVLARPVALAEPIPCRGALNLWTVPDEVEAEIRRRFG